MQPARLPGKRHLQNHAGCLHNKEPTQPTGEKTGVLSCKKACLAQTFHTQGAWVVLVLWVLRGGACDPGLAGFQLMLLCQSAKKNIFPRKNIFPHKSLYPKASGTTEKALAPGSSDSKTSKSKGRGAQAAFHRAA